MTFEDPAAQVSGCLLVLQSEEHDSQSDSQQPQQTRDVRLILLITSEESVCDHAVELLLLTSICRYFVQYFCEVLCS